MPLIIAPTVVTDPPPPPPVDLPPTTGDVYVDDRIPHWSWIAPDGGEWVLDNLQLGWVTPRGRAGLGASPVELVTDPHPRGGVRVRHIQPQSRVITWPLYIQGGSHLEFLSRYRSLAAAFTSTRRLGPGRLRVTRPDGSAREIEAYYQAGFTGEPGWGHLFDQVVLSLLCEDPYWRDVTSRTTTRQYSVGSSYLAHYPTVSSGRTLGATTITNPGEIEAWPSWVITGPATQLVATNSTTGEAFTLVYSLSAGQQITVTTDPPTVRGPAGEVLTSALNWPGAVLWGLQPGDNAVTFAVSGSGSGTAIALTYYPRYETA